MKKSFITSEPGLHLCGLICLNTFSCGMAHLTKDYKMKKVNMQCLLDTPRTVRVSEKT